MALSIERRIVPVMRGAGGYYDNTKVWIGTSATAWAGLDAGDSAAHYQASPAADTSTVLVPAVSGSTIVIDQIQCATYGLAGSPYAPGMIVLSNGDAGNNLFVGSLGAVANKVSFGENLDISVGVGKPLVVYHVLGPDDDRPISLNIMYHMQMV